MKTLGGVLFIYNGLSQDYCFMEAIQCLKELCDQVQVVDAGSTDGTQDELRKVAGGNCSILYLDGTEWKEQQGREKLNYFQNKAKELLTTDYYVVLQGDEIIHENSFPAIRSAIETGKEGFLCRRYNFWRDPFTVLNVEQGRKPCSTEIIRVAKRQYNSVGDGESIECHPYSSEFLDKIEFFHFGFVRDPYVMKKKVIHIQEEVFLTPHDRRLDHSDKFEWDDYFEEVDLKPLHKSLPKFIQRWAAERNPV